VYLGGSGVSLRSGYSVRRRCKNAKNRLLRSFYVNLPLLGDAYRIGADYSPNQIEKKTAAMENKPTEVVLAIFASRDSVRTVLATLHAVIESCGGICPRVDVIVNGNPHLARTLSANLGDRVGVAQAFASLRVWSIAVADKANAWNQCVDKLLPPSFSGTLVCIDGYAMPTPGAISTLVTYLNQPDATLGACGTAQNGSSAARDYYADGTLSFGLRGGLFALSSRCISEFRRVGFSLPIGIYRNDGLIGAALAFGLDTQPRVWDESRLTIFPKIGWTTEPVTSRLLGGSVGYLYRCVRQAQGCFENVAIRDLLRLRDAPLHCVRPPIASLVADWIRTHPRQAVKLIASHPFSILGLYRMFYRQRKWAAHASFDQFLPNLQWDNRLGYGRRATDQLTSRVQNLSSARALLSSLTSRTTL
jgi:hypothetical protein